MGTVWLPKSIIIPLVWFFFLTFHTSTLILLCIYIRTHFTNDGFVLITAFSHRGASFIFKKKKTQGSKFLVKMNDDQVRELYKISKASIRLAESIDQEIKKQEIDKNSSSYVEELTEIKANLELLLHKEASMKEVFGTEWQGIQESQLGFLFYDCLSVFSLEESLFLMKTLFYNLFLCQENLFYDLLLFCFTNQFALFR